jgi:hypothetical protein
MPVGDDFYPYAVQFTDDGRTVLITMNRTFIREVLGGDGDRAEQQARANERRDDLIEEAKSRRSSWCELHEGEFVCRLGLSGIQEWDEGKAFPHLGWPKVPVSAGQRE